MRSGVLVVGQLVTIQTWQVQQPLHKHLLCLLVEGSLHR
jgi:hypothetical protein